MLDITGDLATAIATILAVVTFVGGLGLLALFGFTIRRIIKMAPLLVILALAVFVLPMAVKNLNTKTKVPSQAQVTKVKVLSTKINRVDENKVKVALTLDQSAEVFLKNNLVVILPNGGLKARTVQEFTVEHKTGRFALVTIVINGAETSTLTLSL